MSIRKCRPFDGLRIRKAFLKAVVINEMTILIVPKKLDVMIPALAVQVINIKSAA